MHQERNFIQDLSTLEIILISATALLLLLLAVCAIFIYKFAKHEKELKVNNKMLLDHIKEVGGMFKTWKDEDRRRNYGR